MNLNATICNFIFKKFLKNVYILQISTKNILLWIVVTSTHRIFRMARSRYSRTMTCDGKNIKVCRRFLFNYETYSNNSLFPGWYQIMCTCKNVSVPIVAYKTFSRNSIKTTEYSMNWMTKYHQISFLKTRYIFWFHHVILSI